MCWCVVVAVGFCVSASFALLRVSLVHVPVGNGVPLQVVLCSTRVGGANGKQHVYLFIS